MSNASSEFEFTADEKWVILNSMFSEMGLVRQHLDSFNQFIKQGLQLVVDEERIITPDNESGMFVELEKITLGEPKIKEADGSESDIWPMDCFAATPVICRSFKNILVKL